MATAQATSSSPWLTLGAAFLGWTRDRAEQGISPWFAPPAAPKMLKFHDNRRLCRLLWIVIPAVVVAIARGGDGTASRLDRNDLLVFHDSRGAEAPVESLGDWRRRRAEIVAGMTAVMGPLPGAAKRVPLAVAVDEEVDCGTYWRRRLTYSSEPGSRVPAYLLVPKAALAEGARRPGILCAMPTNKAGNRIVVGLGGPNVPPWNYGQDLAERGYVVIAPAYPLLADYQPRLAELGYQSGTMKAIWDNIRALDLLSSLPFVEPGGFGAIGHSLGGHNVLFTAVFDERIKVVVSSCGFDSFVDYRSGAPGVWTAGHGWCQDRYMPRLLDYTREKIPFDFQEVIGALAPRPLFVSAPVGDSNFNWQSVDRVIAVAAQAYRLYGATDSIKVVHPDGPHDFPPEARKSAYAWLDRFLRDGLGQSNN